MTIAAIGMSTLLAITPIADDGSRPGPPDAPPPTPDTVSTPTTILFRDATSTAGLSGRRDSRVQAVDLDVDGRADLVLGRREVLLNRSGEDPAEVVFEPIEGGLPELARGDVTAFVDLDGDAVPDAIVGRHVGGEERTQAAAANTSPAITAIARGRGDGTFEDPVEIAGLPPGPVAAIAVGDLDLDGRNDLVLGEWYLAYGTSLEGGPTRVLLNRTEPGGPFAFESIAVPDGVAFDDDRDAGGRPTYGVVIAPLLPGESRPQILDLNYGRRANRLWIVDAADDGSLRFEDAAARLGLDGDAVRHGRHPAWLAERAKTDARFARDDEKPFRSHGNTFDAAIGDVDGDGRLDVALAEIAHAWAGDSSDRSRVLLAGDDGRFATRDGVSLDRMPTDPDHPFARRWNQGDLFCALADLDLDGGLDLVLASGDYPDPPPTEQRLRVWRNVGSGVEPRLVDATAASGIDHLGAGQIAIADFDLDGDLDLAVGQSFTRFTPELRERCGGAPQVRLFLNESVAAPAKRSIVLRLRGDRDLGIPDPPFGAIARLETRAPDGTTRHRVRHLDGPGGHAGTQSEAIVHVGIPENESIERVEIRWPGGRIDRFESLAPGRHELRPPS